MSQKMFNQNSKTGSESDSPQSRSPNEKSAAINCTKVSQRRSSRSPRSEGMNISRMAELESQLSKLEEDLNKTKDQLTFSKSQKRRVQKESEEATKDLTAATDNLKDAELKLHEISEGERIHELRRIGQERDRAWQSELEAVRKQQSVDSAALIAAVNELHRLRIHNEMLVSSEVAHLERAEKAISELEDLKLKMAGTVSLVEELKSKVADFEKTKAGYQELLGESHLQFEMAKDTIHTLQCEHVKLTGTLNFVSNELEESKAKVTLLEEVVKKMNADEKTILKDGDPLGIENVETLNLIPLHLEIEQLRSALEEAEIAYNEEQIKSIFHIQTAYEAVESIEIDSGLREARLELQLEEVKAEMTELKLNLLDKETVLQGLNDLNERLSAEKEVLPNDETQSESESKLNGLQEDIVNLKANLSDKENKLQSIVEENGLLKLDIVQKKAEWEYSSELARNEIDTARVAEKNALAKLDMVTELADKSVKESIVLTEQLEAARAANAETESELRKLNVQMQQWRKAAEVAMAILARDENSKVVERIGAFDSDHFCNAKKMIPALLDDDDSDSIKKKNNNVLKRLGIILKKGQK